GHVSKRYEAYLLTEEIGQAPCVVLAVIPDLVLPQQFGIGAAGFHHPGTVLAVVDDRILWDDGELLGREQMRPDDDRLSADVGSIGRHDHLVAEPRAAMQNGFGEL